MYTGHMEREVKPLEQSTPTVKVWDMLNPNIQKLSKEQAAPRMTICQECEFFISATASCKKCGCFMKMKTRLPLAKCPVHKW